MAPRPPLSASPALVFGAAALLLAVFAWGATRLARETSATFDEPGFMAAGYSYLTPGSAEIATTNFRVAQLWLAAPLVPLRPHLPGVVGQSKSLITHADSDLGRLFLADPRNDAPALLRRSRAAVTALGLALGVLLFLWSRRLHGDAAGLVTLALYVTNPVILSNSALATTDLATTLAFAVAVAAVWRLFHRVTLLTIIGAGVAAGALLATKITGLLLVPVAVAMLVVRLLHGPELEAGWIRPATTATGRRAWLPLAPAVVGAAAVAWACVWAVYGFRYAAGVPLAADAWAVLTRPDATLAQQTVAWFQQHHLFPEALLADLRDFTLSGRYRHAFLLGEHAFDGWWYFFPVVWFIKTPPAMLLALGLAAGVSAAAWRRRSRLGPPAPVAFYALTPLLALGSVYGLVAMTGSLNIGIRHLLPLYPCLFVVAGIAARLPWGSRGLRLGVVALLLGWSAIDALRVFPHPLAYVNAFGGGSERGYRAVVDSSYEWGQDLPALERWLAARSNRPGEKPPVFFSTFGNADLNRFKIPATLLPQFFDLRPPGGYALGAGTYVISATMLQSVYGEAPGPWRPTLEAAYQQRTAEMKQLEALASNQAAVNQFVAREGVEIWQQRIRSYDWLRFARLCAWLRQREPDARVTPGLLVYELSPSDLAAALNGPPAELREPNAIKGVEHLRQEQLDFIK